MKIGIYGGSFNPIHFGHIGLAKWVVEHTDLDEVWLMVSPNNPLKDKNILADEQERLEKAREAIGDGRLAIGKEVKGERREARGYGYRTLSFICHALLIPLIHCARSRGNTPNMSSPSLSAKITYRYSTSGARATFC